MITGLVTVFWSLQREISNTVTSPVIIVFIVTVTDGLRCKMNVCISACLLAVH